VAGLKRTVMLLLGCGLISGCALYNRGGETVIYNQGAGAEWGYPAAPGEFSDAARAMSTSNVQVFALDGPPAPPTPTRFQPDIGGGQPAANDSNVIVYSLDDERPRPTGTAPVMLAPPAPMSRDAERRAPVLLPPADYSPRSDLAAPQPLALLPTPERPRMQDEHIMGRGGAPLRIYFAHDEDRLAGEGTQIVRQIAGSDATRVTVEGHASQRAHAEDPVERRIINLKKSMDRAFAVSRALMRAGVPAAAIETRAFGDTRPAMISPGMDSESASRRVEIYTGEPH